VPTLILPRVRHLPEDFARLEAVLLLAMIARVHVTAVARDR
jgi:hypothetical protein